MKYLINIAGFVFFAGAVFFYLVGFVACLDGKWTGAGLDALLCALCLLTFYGCWTWSRYLRMRLRKVDKLSGEAFEQYLKAHFRQMGYRVKETEKTGDYGADLLLTKRGRTTVVQAKRYARPVGIAAVQEVIGAVSWYEADQGMVVTNCSFTRNAVNLAGQTGVDLWDRDRLKKEFRARE